MPEGHSVRLAADQLREVLAGRTIIHFQSSFKKAIAEEWVSQIQGYTVNTVRSHGKNLFIDFSSGWTMYTHFLMWGSWHVYSVGAPWLKEERKARVILHTATHVAVLFSAPVCELIHRDALATHKTAETGPDLLADNFDATEAWRRFSAPAHAEREIGALIMDQTVLAGIGNVLKSEILFGAYLHPQRLPATIRPDEWARFVDTACRLIRASYEHGSFNGALLPADAVVEPSKYGYVYRRRGYPCLRCATPIKMVRQGERQRMTFYCPHCQPYIGDHNPDLALPAPRKRRTPSKSQAVPTDQPMGK
jgi:endonuclease VIII